MASNINNLFQDKTFPSTLEPDQVISLRDPAQLIDMPYESDELASDFLLHAQADLDRIQNSFTPDAPLPDIPVVAAIPFNTELTEETEIARLETIANGAQETLMCAQAVLPPMIRSSKIYVDREKLTIERRTFWGSSDTVSVQMDDINNVEAFIGPLFGEIRIYSKYFVNNVQALGGLWRADAIAVRRLVQGYMIAHNKGIDCSKIEKEHLLGLLMQLGRGSR